MASSQEMTFKRDMSFHIARRRFGYNLPATDIDFLEYDNKQPVLLWEAKSTRSGWRNGKRTASMEAQWNLAMRAEIPYRIVEHNEDWSIVSVCNVSDWNKGLPVIESEQEMTLREFVTWLYEKRGRDIELELGGGMLVEIDWHDRIPESLEIVVFEKNS